jgi:hypothetical protein
LLWQGSTRSGVATWLRILAVKSIGPFDRSSFSTLGHFLLFWVGEKSQGLGFLWGLIRKPFATHSSHG